MSKLYARITKIDEQKRLVYGVASAEEVDAANEVFDYDGSKPYIQAWSQDYLTKTDGLSAGNLRAMHKAVSAGKLLEVSFDDINKIVHVIAKIVDNDEWKKVIEGVYTGFSFGGHSIKKWLDPALAAMRYILKPNELSLADSPCVKSAIFYEVVKLDGSVEKVEHRTVSVEGGDNLKTNILKVGEANDIQKGMYSVRSLAGLLQDLQYLQSDVACEAQYEGDNSPLPGQLKDLAAQMSTILVAMVNEETAELVETMKTELAADIQKAGARNNKNDLMKLQTMHDHAVSLGAKCGGGMEKVLTVDDLNGDTVNKTEMAELSDVQKTNLVAALNRELEPIQKVVDAVAEIQKTLGSITAIDERLAKIEKMELPPKANVQTVPVAKVDDTTPPDPTKKPDVLSGVGDLMAKITVGMDI